MALLLVWLHDTFSSFNLGKLQIAITVRRRRKIEVKKFGIGSLTAIIRNEGKSFYTGLPGDKKSQRIKIHWLD
jgi:hypothetical protein